MCWPLRSLRPNITTNSKPTIPEIPVRTKQFETSCPEAKIFNDRIQLMRFSYRRNRRMRFWPFPRPQNHISVDIAMHKERVCAAYDGAANPHQAVLYDRDEERCPLWCICVSLRRLHPYNVFTAAVAPAMEHVAPTLQTIIAAVADP